MSSYGLRRKLWLAFRFASKTTLQLLDKVVSSEIFWLGSFLFMTGGFIGTSIDWLFHDCNAITPRVLLDLWGNRTIWPIILSICLWINITKGVYRTTISRFMISLMMLGVLTNWILLYAVSYQYLGLIDIDGGEVRNPATSLYFSIVTWTTLGYGDVRPTIDARLLAASEAMLGYIWMAVFIGMFAALLRQWFEGHGSRQDGTPPRLQ